VRILYHSAAPWVNTGYGRCTREIAPRLHNLDHEVGVQCMSAVRQDSLKWHGEQLDYELDSPMTVYETSSRFGLGDVVDHFDDFDADFYFTHFDTWMEAARNSIPEFEIPYASYVIVDHYPVPDAVTDQIQNAHETIAMSKWASEAMAEKGVRSSYIPHGVHTDEYRPIPEIKENGIGIQIITMEGDEKIISSDSRTVFGMVAANHGDRKNIPAHIEAFKLYLEEVDEDALLYMHTDPNAREGYDLEKVADTTGVPRSNLIWSRPGDYQDVGDEYLNKLYNCFDVLMNCSFGESWGLTLTEAQAAGTPVICTNFSSMPEQLGSQPRADDLEDTEYERVKKAPHGVVVDPVTGLYREKVSSKQFICSPGDIFKAMEWYTSRPETMEEDGIKARQHVLDNYDWEEHVIPRFNEMFNSMEALV